jgi:hypothetical protein
VFCPSCRDEFRPGFTHCASCDVDLVESLDAPATPDLPAPGAASAPRERSRRAYQAFIPEQPPVAFCGFLALEEAADARAKLKAQGIRSEILIREDEPVGGEPPKDTYWLRLSPAHFKKAAALLGYDEAPEVEGEDEEGEFVSCSECGKDVGADEAFCPHCGARFEEA